MKYYNSNAIYEYIKANRLNHLQYVAGDAWQLVYGDSLCNPLLLVFAVAIPFGEIDKAPSEKERIGFNLLLKAAAKANLPARYIRFASDTTAVESVRVSDESITFTSLTMFELSALFGSFGLPVSNTQTVKYLNDASSSAYHHWQRLSLGASLTVSDIDLWKLSPDREPDTIFELKRSYYDLQKWKPFLDDYRNFKLISNLCKLAGMQFRIIYNQRIKNPFEDKIDRLKLFTVDFSKEKAIAYDGIIEIAALKNL